MPRGDELLAGGRTGVSRAPATLEAPSIGDVLQQVVEEVNKAHAALDGKTEVGGTAQPRLGAVDVELNFKSVTLNEQGWILFGKDTQESQLEIRLATRILPPE